MRSSRRTSRAASSSVLGMWAAAWASSAAAFGADAPVGAEAALAGHLAGMGGITQGVCSVLGCQDGKLALELARRSDFLLHVWEPSVAAVAAARQLLDSEGLYGERALVEKGSFKRLPYADNTVDLILAAHLSDRDLDDLSPSEVLRVLRPRGKAILGRSARLNGPDGGLTDSRVEQWLRSAAATESAVTRDDLGLWGRLTKPALSGTDEWSHWEHGPDNNPVSADAVIKAPYMTQWLGQPYYIAMPAITTAAGGRIFIAMGHIAHHQREEPWLNTLMANNGYNGAVLWMRKLPDGYLAHRSAFVATSDTFYMIDDDGTGCLLLDPETGQQKDRIYAPDVPGYWKWIAMQDGVLFALVGKTPDRPETTIVRSPYPAWSWGELSKGYYEPRVPWGFGQSILAYDLKQRKAIWVHREDRPVDSRAMVTGGGRLYFYGPDSRIGCLDARTGELLWANDDAKVRGLIEEPGRGLSSTPGFKTTCYALYTPKALFYEAQTQMNVVAVSLKDGSLMWHRKKTSSNPNMLYLDDRLFVGIGKDGSTLALDPMTGRTIEDLGFKKRSCVRLTATPDSLFCRGWPEGVTRYDRINRKIVFNGAFRPSCNDGVIGANGLLYAGPWACDCNLSLIGRVAMCSAGGFQFDHRATEAESLEVGDGDTTRLAPLDAAEKDWTTYRGNTAHSGSISAAVQASAVKVWECQPRAAFQPTTPTAAGGLIFLGGSDGKVRAIDAAAGKLKWSFLTAGPIMQPPTIWNGRAYVGSGDGYVYALEAATGRLLWRFRAAPVERRIMAYGSLCSTWPVNTGVLVKDGVAYAAAGIIDYDGTYVYALDAVTGKIKWQNGTTGHLDRELRKGVSAQGVLTVADGRLWMPGGNVVSPAAYDLKTGEYLGDLPADGSPRTNRGEEIGVLADRWLMLGGRLRYSARENVVDPGSFMGLSVRPGRGTGASLPLSPGKIPPVWDETRIVMVEGRNTVPVCWKMESLLTYLEKRNPKARPEPLWKADWLQQRDTIALAIAGKSVLAVCEVPQPRQLATRWRICCMNAEDGRRVWERDLPAAGLAGGLLVDREGRVIVVMANGAVACYGGEKATQAYISTIVEQAADAQTGRRKAVATLLGAMEREQNADARKSLAARLRKLGYDVTAQARRRGWIADWHLLGPVPWDAVTNSLDKALINEPAVDIRQELSVAGKTFRWQPYVLDDASGKVDLQGIFGDFEGVAVYAYAEVPFAESRDVLLKIGSNDGFKCWFNGHIVSRFDGGRGYVPENDIVKVHASKGVNKVLIKVTQMGGAWAFSARLTDTSNKPIDLNTQKAQPA
jgi:outer membrane protein assembly factor BamB/SAM-dependent methyltransferase